MAYMKRMLWVLLALAEIVVAFVLARPSLIVILRLAVTALFRKGVFQPNAAYFMGMLFGCLIPIAPAAILSYHAVWIARKRIIQTSALMQARSITRAPLLFARWVGVGILAAFTCVFLVSVLILPHPSVPAPGDGILLMLLLMIFVPAGAILGCAYAAVTMTLKTKTKV